MFRVRNVPSALYKALGGFATNGVNMTRLESYMVGDEFAATMFMADVEGHPDEPPLRRALEELEFFTTEVRMLGVYAADAYRSAITRPHRCRGRRFPANLTAPVDTERGRCSYAGCLAAPAGSASTRPAPPGR